MLNLLKSELRSIAKKKTISDYKSMSKTELINTIDYLIYKKNKIKK